MRHGRPPFTWRAGGLLLVAVLSAGPGPCAAAGTGDMPQAKPVPGSRDERTGRPSTRADLPPARKTSPLEQYAWLTGHWAGVADGSSVEEHWSPPLGDSMVGMFRSVSGDGRTKFYELMVIEMEGDQTVLRLIHYSRGMLRWEDEDKPVSYRLAPSPEGELVFVNPRADRARNITYRKTGENSLLLHLEGYRGGKRTVTEFTYTRTGCNLDLH